MEALKLVPQLFFDAIARVVPGLTAMFLYSHFCGWSRWHQFVEGALRGKSGEGFPLSFVISFLLVGGYIAGHLISPFTKLIQRLGEALPEKWWQSLFDWEALKEEEEKFKKKASVNYDWLRLDRPEVGALCAKIRAEFEMYNGLCVVFLGYALAVVVKYVPDTAILTTRVPDAAVLTLAALAMGGRGRATNMTFQKAVNKFAESAKDLPVRPLKS